MMVKVWLSPTVWGKSPALSGSGRPSTIAVPSTATTSVPRVMPAATAGELGSV